MIWHDDALNQVQNREDLARFLIDLAEQIRDGRLAIENAATVDFVDSAGRWARSMDGFFSNVIGESVPETPDWAMVAAMFRAALVYE
ncbi:DUF7660 family protein [Saccharomonospora azurea]|jgi:hypothetical protein|uniref:DUF7660 domain-containing protein n=1 Tax=Saccharomonospora azurea NA-128 TaxID=882081 RepID=H8G7P9_9PSEU|nr:hypothetical protein SacazDRAFT_00343 [Saccharomonospora azurea NA-128]